MIGGWDLAQVAKAQRALVARQLETAEQIAPFAAFIRVMQNIYPDLPDGATLLDAGCGCGHYGVIVARYYPELRYHGSDASAAMIAEATELLAVTKSNSGNARGANLRVCALEENEFEKFDVVLLSQVAEMRDDPSAVLNVVLKRIRQYVILHRLRLGEHSHPIREATYAGQMGVNYLWRLEDVQKLIAAHFRQVRVWRWDKHATMVGIK